MYVHQDLNRPIGELFHPEEDVRVHLEKTGVLREPASGNEMQATILVRDIKASNEMPWSLLPAWRTKGLEADPSSPYEARLFCSHALTRQRLFRFARRAGLREGEMDPIADETMWKRGLYPIRARPASENRVRYFATSVPFTPEEIAGFLTTGPCGEVLDSDSIVRNRFEL